MFESHGPEFLEVHFLETDYKLKAERGQTICVGWD